VTTGRTALPGGAPTKPKKKRASSATKRKSSAGKATKPSPAGAKAQPRAKKPKPPCKYGPRGADGYCPKKPKAAKKPAATSDSFLDRPIPQGTTPAGNKRAPTTIRKEAVKIAESTTKAGVDHIVKETVAAYKRDPEQVKGVLKDVAIGLGKLGVIAAIATGIFQFFLSGEKQRAADIDAQARKMLAATKSKIPAAQWKPEFEAPLLAQYRKWITENLKILYRK